MDLDQIRHDYQKAFRAWHIAWVERADWHREHFFPLHDDRPGLLYEEVITQHRALREAEERAYDRSLQARDVLAEALRTEADA